MKREAIRRLFSRRYLSRLVALALLIVFIPCLIGIISIFTISYAQLNRTNNQYYHEQLSRFSQLFESEISTMLLYANQIAQDSRTPGKAAYSMQQDALLGPSINFKMVFLKALSEYSYASPTVSHGLYYPEYDILFCDPSKYTYQSYLRDAGIPESEETRQFFTADAPQLRFLLYYHPQRKATEMLVGVRVVMGNARDDALFFFHLDHAALSASTMLSENTSDAQFCLWNEDGQVYVCGQNNLTSQDLTQVITGGQLANYTVYRGEISKYGFSSAIVLPKDALTSNLSRFYTLTVTIILLTLLVLIVMLIILIRIIYRPVQHTLDLIDPDDLQADEFQTINNTLIQMKNEITEQNTIVLDHLLSSLLYGTPISDKNIQRTGLVRCAAYQVFVWTALPLNTNERAELITSLHLQMNVAAYVTDLLGRDEHIIICRHPANHQNEQLTPFILRWFEDRFQTPPCVHSGVIVPSMDQLHDSYLSCFSAHNGQEAEAGETEDRQLNLKMENLRIAVEEYLANNYCDSALSQITIADHFGISTYSLSRLFNNMIGISFAQYITNLRLAKAKRLLAETDLSIADITREVGMANPNYFSRLFKQNVGVTPMQYRKQT